MKIIRAIKKLGMAPGMLVAVGCLIAYAFTGNQTFMLVAILGAYHALLCLTMNVHADIDRRLRRLEGRR